MQHQMNMLQEEMEERRAELMPRIQEQMRIPPDLNFSLALLQTEREAMIHDLEQIGGAHAKQVEAVQKLETFSSDLEARHSELDELQGVTRRMGTELKLWAVELGAPPRIRLIENASLSGANPYANYFRMATASAAGLGLVVFGIALAEFQTRRLNSAREVNEGLGLRVMGDLPSLSGRWAGKNSGGRLQAQLTESIDSIRTALIHCNGVTPRVVMVTSAEQHEGKTTVASQLAASLARSGRRTLLVDGDLRTPAAHRVFELPQEPGLCELLRSQSDLDAAVRPTRAANLWLLPAGRCDVQSVQALATDTWHTVAASLRSQYDFVIIDAGPVLKIADPMLIGKESDAAILSVLRDVSQVPKIYEASERLKSVGVNVLGTVVNGVKSQSHPHVYELEADEAAAT
jgi:capsular exopolysaccharide synthesis family protein